MKGLNILDALENLNILVDAESLDEIEVVEGSRLVTHKREKEGEHGIYWVHAGPDSETIEAIKETFRTVHDYLRTFYQRMKKTGDTKQVVEGINTIMVLVGEAAQKMDRFGNLFKQRVTDFKEFQDLQHFYRNHVIKETFKDFALTPIAMPKEKEKEVEEDLKELLNLEEETDEIAGAHILNDLDVIKRDHLYELFQLKNEAGHRFYTLELARKIKLACDFGEFAEEYFGDDPLLQIKNWEDKGVQLQAQKILNTCHSQMKNFYKEAGKYKELELVASVQKALMALMLAANPRNLIRQFSL